MNKTYIKQHSHQNISHAYEHVIIMLFEKIAYSKGLFRVLDYDWIAETHNGIVIATITTKSKMVLDLFKKVITKSVITDDEIIRAVNEISCEYQKQADYEVTGLRKEILELHEKKWSTLDSINTTAKLCEVNWKEECKNLVLGKKRKSDYAKYEFTYKFSNLKQELRPLAIYLMQSMAISHIDHFYNRTPEFSGCYDMGDKWAEWQFERNSDLIGYSHVLIVSKSDQINVRKIKDIFYRNQKEIINDEFKNSFMEFLKRESNTEMKYFSEKNFLNYSGYVVGKLWYKKYCNLENINYLLDNVEIDILRVK